MKWLRLITDGATILRDLAEFRVALQNVYDEAFLTLDPDSPLAKAIQSARDEGDDLIQRANKLLGK